MAIISELKAEEGAQRRSALAFGTPEVHLHLA
jgi:hypothetical protein